MKVLPVSFLLFPLLLAACSLFAPEGQSPAATSTPEPKNGERIYFTAISDRGDSLTYTGGPNFGGMMMGAFLTCASCHGPDGSGGVHYMHMGGVKDAPSIRYSTLNSLPDLQGKSSGYTLQDFQQEVEQGKDLDGSALDQNMPRWNMNAGDLQDLFAFIKSLN